jgi:V-type H+-transporting ATPase subunit a
MISHWKTLSLT